LKAKNCIALVSRSWHAEINQSLWSSVRCNSAQDQSQCRPLKRICKFFCLTIVEHKIIHAKLIAYFIQTGTRGKDEKQLASSSSRVKVKQFLMVLVSMLTRSSMQAC